MSLSKNKQPAAVSLAGNPVYVAYETDKLDEDFIGIHYRVEANIEGNDTQLGGAARHEPDSTGDTVVDIHSLLEWNPSKEFSWPEQVNNLIVKREDLLRSYFIEIDEKYGNPLATDDDDTITGLKVLPGKISDIAQGILNDDESTWIASQISEKKFMTNAPREKVTDAWASERLFFLTTSAPDSGTLNMKVKIYYTDGSFTEIDRQTITGVTQYEVYELVVSFSSLGIFLQNTSKTISKYEIWLEDAADTLVSETFTFVLDHNRRSATKYFLFANAFKMIEGVRFTGMSKSTANYSFLSSNRKLGKDHSIVDPTLVKSGVKEIEVFETSSGWLSVDEMNWLRELLLSQEVYQIINGKTIAVRIESTQIVLHEDDSNLRAINIQYTFGHSDSVPTVLQEVQDILANFIADEIDLVKMTAVTDSNYEFHSMTFDNATGLLAVEDVTENNGHAYSDLLSIKNIPVLFRFWDVSGYYDFCDLEAVLCPAGDYFDYQSEEIEITIEPDNGFGGLLINEDSSILVIKEENSERENQSSTYMKLYFATKRYLEYLYENAL